MRWKQTEITNIQHLQWNMYCDCLFYTANPYSLLQFISNRWDAYIYTYTKHTNTTKWHTIELHWYNMLWYDVFWFSHSNANHLCVVYFFSLELWYDYMVVGLVRIRVSRWIHTLESCSQLKWHVVHIFIYLFFQITRTWKKLVK